MVQGSCHCKATVFDIDVLPSTLTRCTCTFCSKRGALWFYVRPDQFRLLTPAERGKQYSPTNPENRHFFCPECGCATFSDTPDWSESAGEGARRIAISAHLLDDFDVYSLPVEVLDGRNLW